MFLQSFVETVWPKGSLSVTICTLVGLVFLYFIWAVIGRGVKLGDQRVSELLRILEGVEQSDLVFRRGELADRAAQASDKRVSDAWREFDETLVGSPDGARLWNTQSADAFFDATALAPEVSNNRFLASGPSILTALGVLGTFAGLAYGLSDLGGLGSADSTVEELQSGVRNLVDAAGTAFVSSLWGVFFSLFLTVVHRVFERRLDGKIDALQHRIDELFENHSPEESLLHIRRSTDESAKAMDEMAERIGNKLQEVVQQNHAQTAVQSSGVFEVLVEKFTEEFRAMGGTLAARLENATTELSTTLNGMAESTARQLELLDTHLPNVVTSLENTTHRLESVSEQFTPATEKLRATADIFDRSAGALGDAVADGVERLDELGDRTEASAATATQIGENLESLSRTTLTAADRIGEAAGQVNTGFADLEKRLKGLTDSVNQWLNDYEREVSQQVENRMSEWNTHTRDYSDQMTRVTRALADLLEELESSVSRSGGQFDRLHQSLGTYTDQLGAAITHLTPVQAAAQASVVAQALPAGEEVTRAAQDAPVTQD